MKLNLKGIDNSVDLKEKVVDYLKKNDCPNAESLKVFPETKERYLLKLGEKRLEIDIRDNEELQAQQIKGNLCK